MSVHVRAPVRTHVAMDMKRKLIALIKKKKVLYDSSLTEYKDNASRVEAWAQVAEEMDMTAEECKTEWVKLRNACVNAVRRRINHQKTTGKILPPWVLEAELGFIKPFMNGKGWEDKSYTVLFREPEDNEDIEDITPKTEPVTFIVDDDPINAMNEYEISPKGHDYDSSVVSPKVMNEMDESDLFFISLSNTVKKLPKIEQCRLKMDLFKIVNDAEMKSLAGLRKRKRRSSSD